MAPRELETLLLLHPAVAEAAVVAVPMAKFGEVPCAFVVLNESYRQPGKVTEEELCNFIAGEALLWNSETSL